MSGTTPAPAPAAPAAAPAATPAVTIDRLVLDIPGLTQTEAIAVAQEVGERLARAGISDAPPKIGITLGPIGGSRAQLAARIAAAVLERLV
jgi:hypothetical protein